jgi:hypothetical protein
MVRRIRRVRYRAQVEAERMGAEEAGASAVSTEVSSDGTGYSADGTGFPADGRASRPEVNGDAGPGSR